MDGLRIETIIIPTSNPAEPFLLDDYIKSPYPMVKIHGLNISPENALRLSDNLLRLIQEIKPSLLEGKG